MTKNSMARLAGFIYVLVVITGIFNLLYAPSQLIVWTDAATTVSNIQASEFLFRASITAGVMSYIFFLILPMILFDLLKDINRSYAIFMVALAVISVPISIFNMTNKLDVLALLSGKQYLATLSIEQIQAQVMLLLKSYNNGILVVQIFWGLWLFPFGYLVFKSGFIPKVFGILLMLGCFGYLTSFFARMLFPELSLPGFISWPGALGEIGIALWLFIVGIKEPMPKQA